MNVWKRKSPNYYSKINKCALQKIDPATIMVAFLFRINAWKTYRHVFVCIIFSRPS